jgi:hypothetical protein
LKNKNVFYLCLSLLLLPVACVLTVLNSQAVEPPISRATVAVVPATEVTEGEEVQSGAVFVQVCNCVALNVRLNPSADGTVIAWLKPIQRVRVMEVQGDWARLESGGWVHKGYLCH